MNKLNLGSGHMMPDDWENVDNVQYEGNMVVADVMEGLPYPDNHFDFVVINHTLNCFHYDELPRVFNEVKRVMKPGARLRILTPDLDKAIEAYQNNDHHYFPISDQLEPKISGKFARYMFWHGDTKCAFNFSSLVNTLSRNGFREIFAGKFGDCELDSREHESLIMEAIK